MAAGTEHGFALTFGTQGGTYLFRVINGHEETREAIEDTDHSTEDTRTFIYESLVNAGQFDIEYLFEGTVGAPDFATAETITITHPLANGESTAATVAGTGALISRGFPGGTAGGTDLKIGTATVKWDGQTGPAFTAAT